MTNANGLDNDIQLTLIDSTNYSTRLVSVQISNVEGSHFAYASGEAATIETYEIRSETGMKFNSRHHITKKFGGMRGLVDINMIDKNFLLVSNKAENSIEVYQINQKGDFIKLYSVVDTDTTYLDQVITIHPVEINNNIFVFVGGLDKGITSFKLTREGKLHHVQSIKDTELIFSHGIIGMSSLKIADQNFLITGAFFDGGISCFHILENGQLKNISNVMDDDHLFLNGAFPVNTVQLGNQNFLIVGHRHNYHYNKNTNVEDKTYHGDGINVFKVDKQGNLSLHSLLKDNEDLRLKGSTRIEIIKLNEQKALVVIGTRDDTGIQICSIHQDGILRPLMDLDLGYSIYNGMTTENINGNWFLLTGAYDKNLMELYSINY